MKLWHLIVLAVVAVVVVIVAISGGGSSGWSSGDVAKAESALANKLTEEGLTPTKAETECMVKGLEPIVSASELLSNAPNDSLQKKEEAEQVARDCVISTSTESSSSEESPELSTELPESVIGGPACQEDLTSSACAEEEQEKIGAAIEEEEEIAEETLP